MDLKDLANDEILARAPADAKAETQKTPGPMGRDGKKWTLIESAHLGGEQILLVHKMKYLKEAREAYPELVTYLPLEVERLRKLEDLPDYPDIIRKIHMIKKSFGGRIDSSELLSQENAQGHGPNENVPSKSQSSKNDDKEVAV